MAMGAAGYQDAMSTGKLGEVKWDDVIKAEFTPPGRSEATSLTAIHNKFPNPQLLARLFQRFAEGRLDSEAEAAFGVKPSDEEARSWAVNGGCYVGHIMSFRDADGATVPMRVLHIRVVLLMHLQKAAINGSLKKPDNPDVPVKFKNLMDWKDATNALKRSLCACCL